MNELKEITKKVVSYCSIPEELTENHWVSEHMNGSFVECHLDEEEPYDELDKWFLENHPELKNEESFFIEMDY